MGDVISLQKARAERATRSDAKPSGGAERLRAFMETSRYKDWLSRSKEKEKDRP